MAIPRVFVSSTCYDLRYIRENLKYFINNIGYESILSEEGDVFYDPEQHTHDACLTEIHTCQIFVLIIGGRCGGTYLQEDKSITNKEYEEAVKCKIPIFTLVERNVWNDHFVYQKNKKNSNAIVYPNVDNVKIFSFIDEVRKNENNNAIFPFDDFRDIEQYLKKQWAGLMYSFLTNSIETRKVTDLFEEIHRATEKIEYYTKQVAIDVGDKFTQLLITCYEVLLKNETVQLINAGWRLKVTPYCIVKYKNVDELCNGQISLLEEEGYVVIHGGPPYKCSRRKYEIIKEDYEKMREQILRCLQEYGISEAEFLRNEESKDVSGNREMN